MIIEKKILRKEWCKNLLVTSLSLFLLLVLGNLISGFMRSSVNAYEVLINQLLRTPDTITKILPTSCLIASLMTINNLIKSNQLVSIYASGFSPYRVFKKIFLFGALVSIIQFTIGGYLRPLSQNLKSSIIPNLHNKFSNLEVAGLISSKLTNGHMWVMNNNQFIKYQNFDPINKAINNASIYSVDAEGNIKNYISMKKATFNNDWTGESTVRVNSLEKRKSPSLKVDQNKNLSINLSIKDLVRFEQDITTLNFKRLIDYTRKLEESGLNGAKYKSIYLAILATSINCLIFSLLGLGGMFSPNKRATSTGIIASLSLVFIIVFWLIEGYLLELGKSLKINLILSNFALQVSLALVILMIFVKNNLFSKN
ncbi:MAG: hypothetical protein CME61_02130 [Halobacteriovoraceae bacterium]|nr:hypothetical protein [Halobacteriovoraceae bacterium]